MYNISTTIITKAIEAIIKNSWKSDNSKVGLGSVGSGSLGVESDSSGCEVYSWTVKNTGSEKDDW